MYIVPITYRLPFQNLVHPSHTNNVHVGSICLGPGKHLKAHYHGYGQVYHVTSVDKALFQVGPDTAEVTSECVIWIPPDWEHAVRNIGNRDLKYVYFNSWPDNAAKEIFLRRENHFFIQEWEAAHPDLTNEMRRFRAELPPVLIPHPFEHAHEDDGLGSGI